MFLSEDVQKAIAFGDFIRNNAKWELSTTGCIELTKHLGWYNQLVKKIDDHILEVKRTFEKPMDNAPEAPPEPAKTKAKK